MLANNQMALNHWCIKLI